MNSIEKYVRDFFDALTIDADRQGHSYKMLLAESVYAFLQEPNKKNAYTVYSMFFDVYRISCGENRSFVDLLDLLRGYEENTATLSDGQRDHYVHSVNVFLLGLCIYSRNSVFRQAVAQSHRRRDYTMLYSSDAEEFLFTWGTASLFHDIGYPMEIIHNQANKFISFVAGDEKKEISPFISYANFNKLNGIRGDFAQLTDGCFDLTRPTDLIARCIASLLLVDNNAMKATMDGFLRTMQQNGFVDHGFYSAIIVLKWYGESLLGDLRGRDTFLSQITTSATAVFLHNAYKNVLLKAPFLLQPLQAQTYPLAYLLILCDEAQEWNRQAYGVVAKAKLAVDDSAVEIGEDSLRIHYVTTKGLLDEAFLEKKEHLLHKLLRIESVFAKGLTVTATTLSEQYITSIRASQVLPRMLAENIEQLAKKIHADYNAVQLQRHPDKPLEYPSWEALPDSLKYSNVRQAQTIVEKLNYVDCYVASDIPGKEEYILSADDIETLAIIEHDSWMEERLKNGWTYAEVKDAEKKTSPYLVPYHRLTEDIKELDRDTIRNMAPLLASVGLKIYKN